MLRTFIWSHILLLISQFVLFESEVDGRKLMKIKSPCYIRVVCFALKTLKKLDTRNGRLY